MTLPRTLVIDRHFLLKDALPSSLSPACSAAEKNDTSYESWTVHALCERFCARRREARFLWLIPFCV